jgi:hypothetical protein
MWAMPRSVAEFQDDTAFERFVLDRTMPLLPPQEAKQVIDLRGSDVNPVEVSSVETSRGPSSEVRVDDLRPLIFGAAWKVLDLLIELALEIAGIPHDDDQRYSFDTKAGKAGGGAVPAVVPFDARPDLWSRLMRLYASTETLRHRLVHGQIKVDPVTGDMEAVPEPGQPATRPIAASEQSAFCQAAQGAAEAVVTEALSTRRRRQFCWVLDQLTAHHGQSSFGAKAIDSVIPFSARQARAGVGGRGCDQPASDSR